MVEEAKVDPCGVCGKRVMSNSAKCRLCEKWVHARCAGVKRVITGMAGVFECKKCKNGQQERTD